MIDRMALESGDRLISEAGGDVPCPKYDVRGEQQIEVALPAVPRIFDEIGAMTEALENGELHFPGFERAGDFLENQLGSMPSLGIGGQISIDALAHGFRQVCAAGQPEWQGELRAIAKGERFGPFFVGKLRQSRRFGR